MQAKIETLKAKNSADEEYLVYPRTLIKCVTNEHGDNLQDLISDTILEADGRVYVDYGSHEETDEYVPVNADTLDGQCAEYYATAKSVSDIEDGTTVVAEATKATFDGQNNNISETYLPKTGTASDSNKLGGKVASEYALGKDLANHVYNSTTVNTDEEFEALLQTLHANAKDGSYYEHKVIINYQHSVIGGGHRTIEGFKQSDNYGYAIVKAWKTDGGCYIYTRSIINGTWKDWELLATTADLANYLPKTGGKVDGAIEVTDRVKTSRIDALDGKTLLQYTDEKTIVGAYNKPTQIRSLNKTDLTHYVSTGSLEYVILDSGNVGSYAIKTDGGGIIASADYNNSLKIHHKNGVAPFIGFSGVTNGTYTALGWLGIINGSPVYKNAAQTANYDLLHTGNKPSGTYTGNGSATRRDIFTGTGIGDALLIRSVKGFAIVYDGAVAFSIHTSPNLQPLHGGEIGFDLNSRTLYMLTDNICLNAVGVEYKWYVL